VNAVVGSDDGVGHRLSAATLTSMSASTRHWRLRLAFLSVILTGSAVPARADVTVFAGVQTNGGARPAIGAAFGRAPSVVGFEVEYAGTIGDATATGPSSGGVNASLIIQTKPASRRVQLYVIGGLGVWGETYEDGRGSGAVLATNIGCGVKLPMTDWLKLRVDYRLFMLGDAPDAAPGIEVRRRRHRIAAGLSFTF
jgi:hypothetical protein